MKQILLFLSMLSILTCYAQTSIDSFNSNQSMVRIDTIYTSYIIERLQGALTNDTTWIKTVEVTVSGNKLSNAKTRKLVRNHIQYDRIIINRDPEFYLRRAALRSIASKVVMIGGGVIGGAIAVIGAKNNSVIITGAVIAGSSTITGISLSFSSDSDLLNTSNSLSDKTK